MEKQRYYSLKQYFQERFGCRVAKITLDGALSCPNRDGSLSFDGCIFCNEKGSGSGAAGKGISIEDQLKKGLEKQAGHAEKFIAYFQAFSNTYAPLDRLIKLWEPVFDFREIVGISIGTRPDCLDDRVVTVLEEYAKKREVWLELGLQSASDKTLDLINRGHDAQCFRQAIKMVQGRGIKILAHVIIGLPGEAESDIMNTAGFIADLNLDGVKIHSLYVAKNTRLAEMYEQGGFSCLTQAEYVDLAVGFLEALPPGMVIHRLTGDPEIGELVAPEWSLEKSKTLNMIRDTLVRRDSWQGEKFSGSTPV